MSAQRHVDGRAASAPLEIAGRVFASRLLLGTGGFTRMQTLGAAIDASATELDEGARVEVLRAIQGG